MAKLEAFLRTGQLGPLRLGMDPSEAMFILGQPEDQSRKINPLELKYGSLRLTFWKHPEQARSQLMDIGLYYQPAYEPVPDAVKMDDFSPTKKTTEHRFRSFLHEIGYLPVHVVEGESMRQLILLSGVIVSFTAGKLYSLRIEQKKRQEKVPSALSDEREPSIDDIREMLAEAATATAAGAMRSGLVVAWAALEAVLRRTALRSGLQGQIGVQPAVLIRELNSARILTRHDVSFLEEARQVRTGVVHGLAPQPIPDTLVGEIMDMASRLLEKSEKSP
jgi:hypothetical protein